MAADGKVVIEIDGDDSKFKSKLSSLGGAALKGATAAIAAVGAALGTAGAAAVKFGAEYETSLAKVGTIADTGVKSLDTLSGEIMALSNETGESAASLNEALYSAISAGADTAHASELVGVAVKAARGGFTDTETAVDGLTSALNAYGMQTTEAEGLANQFLVTQNLGKTTFGELASSIGTVAPTAKAAGVPINELLSSVASLTANGIGTSEAMTGMKAALSNVIKPTSDAAKMAQQLGIDFSSSALKSKGWAGFLEEIKEKTGGNTEQMAALFGSVEALNTVLTLTSDQGMDLMKKTMGEMETNTTALDDAYNTMSDTLQVTTQKIGTNLKNLGISLYQSVDTPINDIAESALDMVGQLQQAFSEGGLEGLVRAAGDIVAQLVTNLASAAPGMIDAAVSLIQAFLDGLQSNMPALADGAVGIVTSLVEGIAAIAPQLADTAADLLVSLANGFADALPELIPAAVESILAFVQALLDNAPAVADAAADMMIGLADGLIAALPIIIEAVPDILQSWVDAFLNNLDKIAEVGAHLLSALIANLPEIISAVIAAVPDIVAAIVDAFIGLSSSMGDVGIELIKGLWEGIKSMGGWIKDKVSDFFGGIVDSVKEVFGVHSPSTVFADIGKYDMQGLAQGWTKESEAAGRRTILSEAEVLKEDVAAVFNSKDFAAKYGVELAAVSQRMRAAVSAETARVSVAAQVVNEVRRDNGGNGFATGPQGPQVQTGPSKTVIEFRGQLAPLARVLRPHIVSDDLRAGDSFVEG